MTKIDTCINLSYFEFCNIVTLFLDYGYDYFTNELGTAIDANFTVTNRNGANIKTEKNTQTDGFIKTNLFLK